MATRQVLFNTRGSAIRCPCFLLLISCNHERHKSNVKFKRPRNIISKSSHNWLSLHSTCSYAPIHIMLLHMTHPSNILLLFFIRFLFCLHKKKNEWKTIQWENTRLTESIVESTHKDTIRFLLSLYQYIFLYIFFKLVTDSPYKAVLLLCATLFHVQ